MDHIIKLTKLQETVRKEIENLPSVQASFIYGGEFDEADFDYFKGSVEYGTTCLLVSNNGKKSLSANKRTIQDEVNFSVFIVGVNDFDDDDKIASSESCLNTLDELSVLILNNNFGFHLLNSELEEWQQVENTIDKGKRISIYMQSFSLTFKTNLTKNKQLI